MNYQRPNSQISSFTARLDCSSTLFLENPPVFSDTQSLNVVFSYIQTEKNRLSLMVDGYPNAVQLKLNGIAAVSIDESSSTLFRDFSVFSMAKLALVCTFVPQSSSWTGKNDVMNKIMHLCFPILQKTEAGSIDSFLLGKTREVKFGEWFQKTDIDSTLVFCKDAFGINNNECLLVCANQPVYTGRMVQEKPKENMLNKIIPALCEEIKLTNVKTTFVGAGKKVRANVPLKEGLKLEVLAPDGDDTDSDPEIVDISETECTPSEIEMDYKDQELSFSNSLTMITTIFMIIFFIIYIFQLTIAMLYTPPVPVDENENWYINDWFYILSLRKKTEAVSPRFLSLYGILSGSIILALCLVISFWKRSKFSSYKVNMQLSLIHI